MNNANLAKSFASAILVVAGLTSAHAETFGTGANLFTLDFTTIGNAGNSADTNGYGSVGYSYRISKYEISQNQITAATASGLQNVTAGGWSGDKPAANMSWYESAAFVNWLNTSKGFAPAYNLSRAGSTWSMALWNPADNGYDANNLFRNSQAKYFLPSENEFYKAAFGKSDGSGYYLYPTAGNSAPTAVTSGTGLGTAVYNQGWVPPGPASIYQAGGLSSYGTMGQGGNIQEWQESSADGTNDSVGDHRMVRGGYWYGGASDALDSSTRSSFGPSTDIVNLGFRVAGVVVVPEPSSLATALVGLACCGFSLWRRRNRA